MDDDPLDAVRWNWDTAYDIRRDAAGRCLASRLDGLGGPLPLAAASPEALNELIAADYRARPVSRDVA